MYLKFSHIFHFHRCPKLEQPGAVQQTIPNYEINLRSLQFAPFTSSQTIRKLATLDIDFVIEIQRRFPGSESGQSKAVFHRITGHIPKTTRPHNVAG